MKKYLFFLLLFAYSLPQFSQEIRGTVYYLNSDKTPAYGVQITAKGSVGDVSNTDGNYVLKFAKNYPVGTTVYPKVGNKLILKGKKTEEIELVNVEKLEAINIPSDPTLAPIRIIVCKKGERKKVASIVYNTIQKDQEEQLKLLKKKIEEDRAVLGDYDALVIQKNEEYERNLKLYQDTINTYKEAMKIASINADFASDRVKRYLKLIKAGARVSEARKELSTKKAFEEATRSGESLDASIEEIKKDAQSMVALFKFERAIEKYDTLSNILRNERYNKRLLIKNLIRTGEVCMLNTNFIKGEKIYKEIKSIYSQNNINTNDFDYAMTLQRLSGINIWQKNFKDFHDDIEASLKITQKLKNVDSIKKFGLMIDALSTRGLYEITHKKYEEAFVTYNHALSILDSLPKNNEVQTRILRSEVYSNFGLLNKYTFKYDKALDYYNKCLELGNHDKTTENPNIEMRLSRIRAIAYNNIGLIKLDRGKLEEAMKSFENSVRIKLELTKINLTTFETSLATSYMNIGIVHYYRSEERETLKYLHKALDILKKVRNVSEKTHLHTIAIVNDNMGAAYFDLYEYDDAFKYYMEALEIYKEIAIENPQAYLPQVASVLFKLGQTKASQFDEDVANDYYSKSIEVYKKLSVEDPEIYVERHARVLFYKAYIEHFHLSGSYYSEKYYEQGRRLLKEAKNLISFYSKPYSESVTELISQMSELDQFFNIKKELNALKEIERLVNQSVENITNGVEKVRLKKSLVNKAVQFLEKYPDNEEGKNLLSNSYGSLAWYCLFVKDFKDAKKYAILGLETDTKEEWINTNLVLSHILLDEYEKAIIIYKKLKDKPYGNATYKEVFIEDIAALEKAGITHKDFKKVKELLNQ